MDRELVDEVSEVSDLVNRLRAVTGGKLHSTNTSNALRIAAAARIDQLERELAGARENLCLAVKSADLADAAIDTARNDALGEASDVDMIFNALMGVHDMDVTLSDYAKAVSEAILTLKRPTS